MKLRVLFLLSCATTQLIWRQNTDPQRVKNLIFKSLEERGSAYLWPASIGIFNISFHRKPFFSLIYLGPVVLQRRITMWKILSTSNVVNVNNTARKILTQLITFKTVGPYWRKRASTLFPHTTQINLVSKSITSLSVINYNHTAITYNWSVKIFKLFWFEHEQIVTATISMVR